MLDTVTLAQSIQKAFDNESDKGVNPAEARLRMAQALAGAIEVFVKTGSVTGSCENSAGVGTIAGTIS